MYKSVYLLFQIHLHFILNGVLPLNLNLGDGYSKSKGSTEAMFPIADRSHSRMKSENFHLPSTVSIRFLGKGSTYMWQIQTEADTVPQMPS